MISSFIGSRFRTPLFQTGLTFVLGLGLASALWVVTMPVAIAKLMAPEEMIQAGLPPGVMVNTAGKPQFLTAVCAAVKTHHESAARITKAAVAAHKEYAGEIVTTAVRCARGEKIDCELTGAIVAAAIVAAPQSAAVIDDAATATAPECADSVQTRTERSDGKQVLDGKEMVGGKQVIEPIAEGPDYVAPDTPPFLPPGGGGFNPGEPRVLICYNGRQRSIRESQLQNFLDSHPGAFVGNCEITPATSR